MANGDGGSIKESNGNSVTATAEKKTGTEGQGFKRKEHVSKDTRSVVVSAVLAARQLWEDDRNEKNRNEGRTVPSRSGPQDAFDAFNPVIGTVGVKDTSLGRGDTNPPLYDIPGNGGNKDIPPARKLTTVDPDGSTRTIAKFEEPVPIQVNGVLEFLGQKINATQAAIDSATRKGEAVSPTLQAENAKLIHLRDVIDRNSVATNVDLGGVRKPEEVVRKEAKKLADREGRAVTDEDIQEARLRVANVKELVLPPSTPEDAGAALLRRDASLGPRRQLQGLADRQAARLREARMQAENDARRANERRIRDAANLAQPVAPVAQEPQLGAEPTIAPADQLTPREVIEDTIIHSSTVDNTSLSATAIATGTGGNADAEGGKGGNSKNKNKNKANGGKAKGGNGGKGGKSKNKNRTGDVIVNIGTGLGAIPVDVQPRPGGAAAPTPGGNGDEALGPIYGPPIPTTTPGGEQTPIVAPPTPGGNGDEALGPIYGPPIPTTTPDAIVPHPPDAAPIRQLLRPIDVAPLNGQPQDPLPPHQPVPGLPTNPNGLPYDPELTGVVANYTEQAGRLATLEATEFNNANLREKRWPAFFDILRKTGLRNFETMRRAGYVDRLMRCLGGQRRHMLRNQSLDAIAVSLRGKLDRGAVATAERIRLMQDSQAALRGEQRQTLAQGDILRTQLIDRIVRPVALGYRTFTPEQLRAELTQFIDQHRGNQTIQQMFGAGTDGYGFAAQEFAADLIRLGEAARNRLIQQQEVHDAGFNRLDQQINIVLARARADVQGNTNDVIDNAIISSRRRVNNGTGQTVGVIANVAKTIGHPLFMGALTTVAVNAWTYPAKIVGRFAAPLAPFTPLAIGSVVAGGAAAFRRNREVGRDNRFTEVSVGAGRVVGGENRGQYERIFNMRNAVDASVLVDGTGVDQGTGRDRRSVDDIVAILDPNRTPNPDPNDFMNAQIEARSRLAEIFERERLSVIQRKPLIIVGDNSSDARNRLMFAENRLIAALGISAAGMTPQQYDQAIRAQTSHQIVQWSRFLSDSQEAADHALFTFRTGQALRAGLRSTATAFVGGMVAQEVGTLGLRGYHTFIKKDHQYIGPTLLERTVNGAATHGPRAWRESGLAHGIDFKTSPPTSLAEFKAALNGNNIHLRNGYELHPDHDVSGKGMKLVLFDDKGQALIDGQGKPLDIPMYVRPDGTVLLEADVNKLQLPGSIKSVISEFNPSVVDVPFTNDAKQALVDANAGKQVFLDIPNPITNKPDHVQVFAGGKFWLPSTPHVMGQIQSDGSLHFTGAPVEIHGLHDALDKVGAPVDKVVDQNNTPFHDRITALIKSNPNGGDLTTDEGRFKITYDGTKAITVQDMSLPGQPVLHGTYYMDKEINPTNFTRPGGPRGDLANFKFSQADFKNMSPAFKDNLKEAGFTGRGFLPTAETPGIPDGYKIPLEGNDIALASPDTAANSTLAIPLQKHTIFTPADVQETFQALPTPGDARKPLEGYGTPVQATVTAHTPTNPPAVTTPLPQPAAPATLPATNTPAPAPTAGGTPAAAQNTVPQAIQTPFNAAPQALQTVVGQAYAANQNNHQAALAALTAWQPPQNQTPAEAAQVAAQVTALQVAIAQQAAAAAQAAANTPATPAQPAAPATPAANPPAQPAAGGTPAQATAAAPAAGATTATPATPSANPPTQPAQATAQGFRQGVRNAFNTIRGRGRQQAPATAQPAAPHA